MNKKSPAPDGRRLSRENWIDGAITYLSSRSVASLRVDVLAGELGVTKGSFYWHFSSREELMNGVLDTWRQRMTEDIDTWLKKASGRPEFLLKKLFRIGISSRLDVPGGPLELSLRDWARHDPRVQAVVSRVDAERVAILKNLYLETGLDDEDAAAYALMHMSFVAGGQMMLFGSDPREIERRRRIGERFLVPKSAAMSGRASLPKRA
ncbi:MAG: TetR/AcrR family transcriptional regulator [Pseudomonadota bacterium]|nr:TetR/AcrR family transcriptional regulator [Pseudomonadota bacterium]